MQVVDQLRPLDAPLDVDQSFVPVEFEDAVAGGHVEEDGIFAELLPAHGVPAAGNADRLARALRGFESGLDAVKRVRLDDPGHTRSVELRLHIVNHDPGRFDGVEGPRRQRQHRPQFSAFLQKLASC